MAKKVWISFPLTTSCDTSDASVVAFLKGGMKKELEVEVAAFLTKWLMDKDVPYGIDFGMTGVDRALVIGLLPKRLQKILGGTVTIVVDSGEGVPVEAGGAAGPVAEVENVPQTAEPGAGEAVTEAEEVGAELPGGDGSADGSSELR